MKRFLVRTYLIPVITFFAILCNDALFSQSVAALTWKTTGGPYGCISTAMAASLPVCGATCTTAGATSGCKKGALPCLPFNSYTATCAY